MKSSLRPFAAADVQLIEEWISGGDATRYMSRWLPRSFSHGSWSDDLTRWHIIMAEGREIGTIWIERDSRCARAADLGILIADPAFRGRGLGSEAIQLAEGDAVAVWGIAAVRLRVRSSNLRAISCYRRSGYEVAGTAHKEIDGALAMILQMEHRLDHADHR